MNFDGGQLARAMMSIHEAELEQSTRYPGTNLSARIERRIVLRRRGNRTLCRLRGLLVTIGRRLQQYGLSQPLRLEGDAAPVEETGSC